MTATISYDASNQSYSLTTPTGSITFAPSDIDSAQSSAGATVYKKINGNRTDLLTLTNPGTSGPITYQYVGSAFWQQSVIGSNSGTGSLDAIVYGVPTLDANVPRSGSATFDVDLIGATTIGSDVAPLAGVGTASVDFGKGSVIMIGEFTLSPLGGPNDFWSASATLSANSNQFSGSFTMTNFGQYNGEISGMFFGPQAQEIGATWSASTVDRVATGTIMGRESSTPPNTSFPLQNLQSFGGDAEILAFDFPESFGFNTTTGQFSNIGLSSGSLGIIFDPISNSYVLSRGNLTRIWDIQNQRFSDILGAEDGSFALWQLDYVAAVEWLTQNAPSTEAGFTLTRAVVGFETPTGEILQTGTAGFAINIRGIAADNEYRNPMRITGSGDLFIDLATGRVSGYAPIDIDEIGGLSGLFPVSFAGDWTLNGLLAAGENGFAGTVTITGIGDYNGTASGKFFGPNMAEVGGTFAASEAGGNAAVGVFYGNRDDTIKDPTIVTAVPLADLPGPTDLSLSYVAELQFPGTFSGLNYDPTSGTYQLQFTFAGSPNLNTITLSDAQRNAGESSTLWDAYTSSVGGTNLRMLIPTAAQGIQLTYSSFAEFGLEAFPGPNYDRKSYLVFGVEPSQMPRTGGATYSGISLAEAEVNWFDNTNTRQTDFYALRGTSQLTADFGLGTFILDILGLTGDKIPSPFLDRGAAFQTLTLTDFQYSGGISGSKLIGSTLSSTEQLQGGFFGPNADEFAAAFSNGQLQAFGDTQGSTFVIGIAAGTKN